jgi:TRAP-type C4-dicarboxylate transport system substrate-binding protein
MSKLLFTAVGLRGVPMGVPDVLPGLSTGQIDSFFASPLSALALQWSTHAKYVTSMIMSQASGASILSKKVFDTLTPEDQKVVMEEAAALETKLLKQIREDNDKALKAMKDRGLEVVPTPADVEKELRGKGESVAEAEGKKYPGDFQTQVRGLVDAYRKKHPMN